MLAATPVIRINGLLLIAMLSYAALRYIRAAVSDPNFEGLALIAGAALCIATVVGLLGDRRWALRSYRSFVALFFVWSAFSAFVLRGAHLSDMLVFFAISALAFAWGDWVVVRLRSSSERSPARDAA